MTKLLCTVGIQGSGKSTWAKQFVENNPQFYRINGDEVRRMADFSRWNPKKEQGIQIIQEHAVKALLKAGHSVLWDNMNVSLQAKGRCRATASVCGAELEWKEFNTPLDQCIKNDREGRGSLIGRAVIENTARRSGLIPWNDYRQLVIVDIDGTLTDVEWRQHYVTGLKKDWATFLSLCAQDKLREPVAKWVRALAEEYDIVLVSGRNEKYYEHEARTDLQLASIPYKRIFMRSNEDHRKDYEVKLDILKGIPHDKIAFAIDDRPVVVEKVWRASRIKVYPVGALSQPEYW